MFEKNKKQVYIFTCISSSPHGKVQGLKSIFIRCPLQGSVAGQPRWVRTTAGVHQRLHVCDVVVTEVDVSHVGCRLVIACDIGNRGDGVLFSQHPQCEHGDKI